MSDDDRRRAGIETTEVTLEMLEAGLKAYYADDWLEPTDEERVIRIYRAMRFARKSDQASQ